MTTPASEHPHDELAILALDALGADERDGIEAHVRSCPACQAELDDYRATLALVAPEEPIPPASTWQRIADQVAAASNGHSRRPIDGDDGRPPSGNGSSPGGHPSPVAVVPTPERGTRRVGLVTPLDPTGPPSPADPSDAGEPPITGPAGAEIDGDGPVVARHARRPRPSTVRRLSGQARRPLALAAAAAVVVVLGIGVALRGTEPGAEDEVVAAARQALASPDASVADLVGPDGQVMAQVVVDGDEGYALVEPLTELPEGREYQLWSLDGVDATSLGMVGNGSDRAIEVAPTGPDAVPRLAITEEPAGGVDSPTGQVVATGSFT